jgi:hypothetical protein
MERMAAIAALGLVVVACDTMIADRLVIRAPAQGAVAPPSVDLLDASRAALVKCNLAEADMTSLGDALHWRNPIRPPGLHIMVHRSGDEVTVTLAQDLYGPIGPTDAYQCVRQTLTRGLEDRFGKEKVRVKS